MTVAKVEFEEGGEIPASEVEVDHIPQLKGHMSKEDGHFVASDKVTISLVMSRFGQFVRIKSLTDEVRIPHHRVKWVKLAPEAFVGSSLETANTIPSPEPSAPQSKTFPESLPPVPEKSVVSFKKNKNKLPSI
jgi:hypothetical protein